jgi:hypothetical protein
MLIINIAVYCANVNMACHRGRWLPNKRKFTRQCERSLAGRTLHIVFTVGQKEGNFEDKRSHISARWADR